MPASFYANQSGPLARSFSATSDVGLYATQDAARGLKKQSTSNTFQEVRDEALAGGLFRSFTHMTNPQEHSQGRLEFENNDEDEENTCSGSLLRRLASCPASNECGSNADATETNSNTNVNNAVEVDTKTSNDVAADECASTAANSSNASPAAIAVAPMGQMTGPVGSLAGNATPPIVGFSSIPNVNNNCSLSGFPFNSAASVLPLSADPLLLSKPTEAGSQTPSTNTSTPRPLPVMGQAEAMGLNATPISTNGSGPTLGGTSAASVVSDESSNSDAGTTLWSQTYSNPSMFGASSTMFIPPPMAFPAPFGALPMQFPTANGVLPMLPPGSLPFGPFPPLTALSMMPPMMMSNLPVNADNTNPPPVMLPMQMAPLPMNRSQPLHLQSVIPDQRNSFATSRISAHSVYAAAAPPAAAHPQQEKGLGPKGKGKQAPLGPGFSRNGQVAITTPEGGKKEGARHHFLMRKAKKMSSENGLSVQENYEAIRQEQEDLMAQKMFARSHHHRGGNNGGRVVAQKGGAYYGKGMGKW